VHIFEILVVEDFVRFLQFILSSLQRKPEYKVVGQASDGWEAIQLAEQLQPDLVLLDVALPKLNGIEAARHIREAAPRAKILFFSLNSSPDVVWKALSLGAMGYVIKGRASTDLLPAVEAVLGGRQFVSPTLGFTEGKGFPGPNHHEIVFCSDDSALLESLADFIAPALKEDNPSIVLATEPHRSNLILRLRRRGVEIDSALLRGAFISADISEPPDRARILSAVRGLREACLKVGNKHPRIAVCGERAGHFWASGRTLAALQLEQLFSELAKIYEMDILCVYPSPQGLQDDEGFKSICAEHTAVSHR